ncbi:iron-containing alcohol dehydrogenase [Erwinia psidii]|uniref:Iron-containing alcohol dehydrogenase n=1 Tax=Erwinia psidii TaxID=69224 RepID=A0A3N6RWT3_9GAMM|nr:iron-containing alcohol dehydrogenase [Erwinia psidii]MCX8957087.1 iron-containing alcohol dehydrogenase [Erwinia psidii]MCX8961739.1 iron-containing alcohol dehydrogenase [Erwinia psidii]MCX8965333.1 iron-containing alcohol dehydrogenase [Erwinia psidii]RQM37534.1 iron-containing alcohol dehydrogenase [Erwinia psidii]
MIASQMIANRQTFFGQGSLRQLLPLLTHVPVPTLLFCGHSFLHGPAWEALRSGLEPLFIGHEIVSHEASPTEIDAWVSRWRGKAERVVAIGGGSVLDAAKAFAALSQHPHNTLRYLEKVGDTSLSGETLPLIAIPTTAGTGSEVTQNAVVTDKTEHKVKASLRHANFVPQIAILDPDLLRGAPAHLLACCAIDTFTHLFEAWLSCKGNLFTRQTALNGMRAFISGWPYLDHQDARGDLAREQMMMASWLGGLSLSMAGLGVIHGIAGELGAIRDYHHGEVCGRLLLPFLHILNKTENQQQQSLMADLTAALFPGFTLPPARMLAEWLKERAVTPFWHDAPVLTVTETDWILARSTSKNSLVTYSKEQQRFMLEEAFSVQ